MEVELVLDAHATIGESPTWAAREAALYWIDVKAPALHRFEPASGGQRSWRLPADVGAFALVADRPEALVALRTGLFRLDLRSGGLTPLAPAPFDGATHRFNEGACDGSGRFWIGIMFDPVEADQPPRPGSLYSYTPADGLRPEPDSAELHNGMAWSPDGKTFYLAHSNRQVVLALPFDAAAGRFGPARPFLEIPEPDGLPDGAAVDEEGGYWCALHGGWRIRRYHADGTPDRDVRLPVSQPTMCAFAGPELDAMYVTSAAEKLSPEQLRQEPHAGGLFRFAPGVRGIPRPHHSA